MKLMTISGVDKHLPTPKAMMMMMMQQQQLSKRVQMTSVALF
jgi:hypothetical protein